MGLWQAVGLSRDLGAGQVMATVVAGRELAIWRSASGKVSAFADRCPHRGMRLSHGFVRGESLACLYHGWVYGMAGTCQHIPAHPALAPPDAIRVQGARVAEADGVIWVAPQETADAPPDLGGWTALRSMPFDCAPEVLASLPGFRLQGDGQVKDDDLCLLLQPRSAGLMVHALTRGDDPLAASRRLERLRYEVEA